MRAIQRTIWFRGVTVWLCAGESERGREALTIYCWLLNYYVARTKEKEKQLELSFSYVRGKRRRIWGTRRNKYLQYEWKSFWSYEPVSFFWEDWTQYQEVWMRTVQNVQREPQEKYYESITKRAVSILTYFRVRILLRPNGLMCNCKLTWKKFPFATFPQVTSLS